MLFILGILKKIIHKLIWTWGKYERKIPEIFVGRAVRRKRFMKNHLINLQLRERQQL